MSDASQSPVDAHSPFPGLHSFTENAAQFFHGREHETAELFRRLRRGPLTVLFGKSGLGKTSLLQAGLYPLLRHNRFLPIPVRVLFARGGESPVAQIKRAVTEAAARQQIEAPPPDDDETLWEYFHRARFWDRRNRLITPVLAMDQFEEIFTAADADEAAERLVTELEDLIENRIPAVVRRRIEEEGEGLPFPYARQPYRVVLSLREDFLPQLEGLAGRIPSIMEERMRLTAMRGTQALEAVTKPAGDLVTPESARRIVRFVAAAGEDETGATASSVADVDALEVEPALLALVCFELNSRRVAEGRTKIDADLLAGARDEILASFYERCVAGFGFEVRGFVEERLLTGSGFRSTVALDDARSSPGLSEEAIAELVRRRLLRTEMRLGIPHVELTHDVLTNVVQAYRDRRREEAAREAERALRRRWIRRAALVSCLSLGVAAAAAFMLWQQNRAWRTATHALVDRVLDANIENVPKAIEALGPFRDEAELLLEDRCGSGDLDEDESLRAHLALLPADPEAWVDGDRLAFLEARLRAPSSPTELVVIRDALLPRKDRLIPGLWDEIENGRNGPGASLSAAMALATYDPPVDAESSARWRRHAILVATALIDASLARNATPDEPLEALQPAATELLDSFGTLLSSPSNGARRVAAKAVGRYAADRPETLMDRIVDADTSQFEILLASLSGQPERAIESMKARLAQPPPLVGPPPEKLVSTFASADGLLDEDTAFCQAMTLEVLSHVAEELRALGYRPVRCRPYETRAGIRVATTWHRDHVAWHLSHGLTAEQLRVTQEAMRRVGFVPVDVAGYASAEDESPAVRFAGIWLPSTSPDQDAHVNLGVVRDEYLESAKSFRKDGFEPHTLQIFVDHASVERFCGIWRRKDGRDGATVPDTAPAAPTTERRSNTAQWRMSAEDVRALAEDPDKTVEDASVMLVARVDPAEYWTGRLADAEKQVAEREGDVAAVNSWAGVAFHLGKYQEIVDRITAVVTDNETERRLYYWRCVSYARLGRIDEATADAVAHERLARNVEGGAHDTSYLRAVVAAWSGDGARAAAALRAMDDAGRPGDSGDLYDSACAHAVAASKASAENRGAHARRAIELLRQAIDAGYDSATHLQVDSDMVAIRDDPAFAELLASIRPSYAAIHFTGGQASSDAHAEDEAEEAGKPTTPRERTHAVFAGPAELAREALRRRAAGFRPIVVSVAAGGAPPGTTVSLWQTLPSAEQERLRTYRDRISRRRNANALSVLSRLERDDEALELIREHPMSVDLEKVEAQSDGASGALLANTVRLEAAKRQCEFGATKGNSRKWWLAFERENQHRLSLVIRTAEEIAERGGTIDEFFFAYVYSNTDNIQANLHYLDFTRLKKAEQATRKANPDALDTFGSFPPGVVLTAGARRDLEEVEARLLRETATNDARAWWTALRDGSGQRPDMILRLAGELEKRSSTVDEAFLAATYSRVEDGLAWMHFLDFMRVKEKARKSEAEDPQRDAVLAALREYCLAMKAGRMPPGLPPISGDVRTEEDLAAEVSALCSGLGAHPGEISPDLIHYVVSERAGLFRQAIAAGLAPDVPDTAAQLSKAGKYLVHEKEIALYILLTLPRAPSLTAEGRAALQETRDGIEEKFEGLEGWGRRFGRNLDTPAPAYNQKDTTSDLLALSRELCARVYLLDIRNAMPLLQSLRPDAARVRLALREDVSASVVERIVAHHDGRYGVHPVFETRRLIGKWSDLKPRVSAASTEELHAGGWPAKPLPAEARQAAGTLLRPGMTFYVVELPEGDLDLVFWDGEQWTMLGPIWEAIELPEAEPSNVARLLTGQEGGTYYVLGQSLREILAPTDYRLGLGLSAGSKQNLVAVSLGLADLAFVQADVFAAARKDHGIDMSDVTLVAALYPEEVHVVVRRGAGIEKFPDLKGKRVNVGGSDSGTAFSARALLEGHGIAERDVRLDHRASGAALQALLAGELDAVFFTGGQPVGLFRQLPAEAGETIALLPIEENDAWQDRSVGPLMAATIDANSYPWVGQDVPTVATRCLLIAHADTDARIVHRIAKTIHDRRTELARRHPKWSEADTDLARRMLESGQRFHRGAVRFLRGRR